MALTICGVEKLRKLPGCNWLLRPELMQLPPGHDAAHETPKLPYFPQFYIWPILMISSPVPGDVTTVLTGKVIHSNSYCIEFGFVI